MIPGVQTLLQELVYYSFNATTLQLGIFIYLTLQTSKLSTEQLTIFPKFTIIMFQTQMVVSCSMAEYFNSLANNTKV